MPAAAEQVVLLDQFGRPLRPELARRPPRAVRHATYDAADSTSPALRRHWANADALSAKAANSPEVRRKLRERARLEFDNGGNCKGAIETIAHDLVGTGPRLQLTLPEGAPDGAAAAIEAKFHDWCDDPAVNFADKLRVMVESELRDGESFALLVNNDAVEGPVKLDFQVIETEQVATPNLDVLDPNAVDGIEFDKNKNPIIYHVLKEHPGDSGAGFTWSNDFTRVPAENVVHWFRPSRAGHVRGIPRITPGLPLHAMIRGYSSATLAAARLAAHFAGVIETELPPPGEPDGSDPPAVETYDEVPVYDAGLKTMPYGWKLKQLEPTQPTATHKEFRETNLTEFGRAIHTPRNIVTGDSAGYNFSSARLDFILYRGAIRIDRNRLAIRVIDKIFKAWAADAATTRDYLPPEVVVALPDITEWTWQWRFSGFPSINPTDDANADEKNLQNGLVTHGELLAERGVDWRDHFKSLAEQRSEAKRLGIEDLLYPWLAKAAAPAPAAKPAQQAERDTVLEDEEEVARA